MQSLATAAAPSTRGTVQAHAAAAPTHTCATWELGCGASGLDCSYTCTKMISCPGDAWTQVESSHVGDQNEGLPATASSPAASAGRFT